MTDDAELIARPLDEEFDTMMEVQRNPYGAWQAIQTLAEQRDALEAKLEKAVEALDEAVYLLKPDEKDMMRQAGVYRIVTTLAEIKGESHD